MEGERGRGWESEAFSDSLCARDERKTVFDLSLTLVLELVFDLTTWSFRFWSWSQAGSVDNREGLRVNSEKLYSGCQVASGHIHT